MSIRCMVDLWERAPHGGTELLVALKIADHAGEDRQAWPSVAHLARRCRVGERTVRYALRALEGTGTITTLHAGGGRSTARYRINCEGAASLAPGAVSCPPALPEVAPESSVEPSLKIPTESPRAGAARAVWDAWLDSTQRRRSVFDQKRRALVTRRLKHYDVEELIDAVRGWQRSAWHSGENPSSRPYNDLELILRDSAHIEMFRDLQRGVARSDPLAESLRSQQEYDRRRAELQRQIDEDRDA